MARATRSRAPWIALALGSVGALGLLVAFWRIRPALETREDVALQRFDASHFDTFSPATPSLSAATTRWNSAAPLYRRPLSAAELGEFQPKSDLRNYPDLHTLYSYRPHFELEVKWPEHPRGAWRQQTNGLGLRSDAELRIERPWARVLVAGDSHTDGVCDNEESFVRRLEIELERGAPGRSVEGLNAGHGGYSLHSYLGVLERFAWLLPDVFAVTIYGGNDFEELLTLHHLFAGSRRPDGMRAYGKLFEAAQAISRPGMAQCLVSAKYFAHNPDQISVALNAACALTAEIAALCAELSAAPIFVYLPPLLDVQRERYDIPLERLLAALRLSPEDLRVHDSLADDLLAFLRSNGASTLDLRPHFAAAEERLYWERDHHVNVAGHRRIAELLAPLVEAHVSAAPRPRPTPAAPPAAHGGPSRERRLEHFEMLASTDVERTPVPSQAAPRRFVVRASEPHPLASGDASPARTVIVRDARLGTSGATAGLLDRLRGELEALGIDSETLLDAARTRADFDSCHATVVAALRSSPRVVVVAIDEDDDWLELSLSRPGNLRADPGDREPYLTTAARFAAAPVEGRRTLQLGINALADLATRCRSGGARLVLLRIPSPWSVPAAGMAQRRGSALAAAGLERADLERVRTTSLRLCAAARVEGVEVLDLGVVFHMLAWGGYDEHGRLTDEALDVTAALLARSIARER